jgi:RNA-directed DNA polymerase
MSGPGDRAPRSGNQRRRRRGHTRKAMSTDPKRADVDQTSLRSGESSARSQMLPARKPGDLRDALLPMVGAGQPREDDESQSVGHVSEKSDEVVVPQKSTKTRVTPVESMEERAEAKRKSAARNAPPAQDGNSALTYLQRIGSRAKIKPEERFTNLLSHIKAPLLKQAYKRLRKDAASGVDGVTWEEYGERLDERLLDLQDRVHRGSYHPQPVRRVHIAKSDGRTRPLGIPALEDKIVQQAVRMILEPIYEAMFIGFSYGYRPGRSPHDALDALAAAIQQKVDWVLDADIRAFFDTIDHGWLQKFIEHRIGDKRMVRLLMKWVHAGVMEEGKLHEVEAGTPQGGIISPLMANIYLHYVLDLWVCQWRKKRARGEVYFVRFADDIVMGFQKEQDAVAMREALVERLANFGLELASDKTKLLRFGRFARREGSRLGLPKPETFDFLGFTHISAVNVHGRFQLTRKTSRKKRRVKLVDLRKECWLRRHDPVPEQHVWLSSVLTGHFRYFGVPTNSRTLYRFRRVAQKLWHRALQRRSQNGRWTLKRLRAFEQNFPLPEPRILHPWPEKRFAAR